jgi:regulator of sirC expression with transglutaminase-like and TPR domain
VPKRSLHSTKRCVFIAAFFVLLGSAAALAAEKPEVRDAALAPTNSPESARDPLATVVDLKDTKKPPVIEQPAEANATELPRTALKPPARGTESKPTFAPSEPRSFKELAALPDEQFDLAEAVLALGAEDGFSLSTSAMETLQRLDVLAARAKTQLPDNPELTDYFDALYDVVLIRKPCEAAHDERPDDFDLSRAVFQHRGTCMSIGISALAVARRMGAPINGAQCPGHFFLRGTGAHNSKGQEIALNFDVTRPTPENWAKIDDDFYRKWRHFDAKAEASSEYLHPMTDKQVISAFLSSRSGYLAREKNFEAALADAQRALALNAKNIYALINSGYAHESLKQLDEAEDDYKHALEIDPHCARAMNNLAFVKIRDKHSKIYDIKRAEKYIDQALKIDPDQAYLYATKGEVCAARGDYKDATLSLLTACSLAPKNSAYRERFMALREHSRREISGDPIDKQSASIPKRDKSGDNRSGKEQP